MNLVDRVKEFAAKAHGEQRRKYTPELYIVHPIRVMEICKRYTDDAAVLCAALLHDVLEDTATSKEEIYDFLLPLAGDALAKRILHFVVELTDVYVKKDFPRLNRQARKELECARMATISPEAQTIKYADMLDNCSEITVHDPAFAIKFLKECKKLLSVMPGGNPALRSLVATAIAQKLSGPGLHGEKKPQGL